MCVILGTLRFMIPQFSSNSVFFLIKYGRIYASPPFKDELTELDGISRKIKTLTQR